MSQRPEPATGCGDNDVGGPSRSKSIPHAGTSLAGVVRQGIAHSYGRRDAEVLSPDASKRHFFSRKLIPVSEDSEDVSEANVSFRIRASSAEALNSGHDLPKGAHVSACDTAPAAAVIASVNSGHHAHIIAEVEQPPVATVIHDDGTASSQTTS
jgi:hypothetical protein